MPRPTGCIDLHRGRWRVRVTLPDVERLALRLAASVLDAESYSGHHARAGGER